jgi:hypothetical protein
MRCKLTFLFLDFNSPFLIKYSEALNGCYGHYSILIFPLSYLVIKKRVPLKSSALTVSHRISRKVGRFTDSDLEMFWKPLTSSVVVQIRRNGTGSQVIHSSNRGICELKNGGRQKSSNS